MHDSHKKIMYVGGLLLAFLLGCLLVFVFGTQEKCTESNKESYKLFSVQRNILGLTEESDLNDGELNELQIAKLIRGQNFNAQVISTAADAIMVTVSDEQSSFAPIKKVLVSASTTIMRQKCVEDVTNGKNMFGVGTTICESAQSSNLLDILPEQQVLIRFTNMSDEETVIADEITIVENTKKE